MAINDRYSAQKSHISQPSRRAWIVTPSDDTDVAQIARWLRCDEAGTLRLTLSEMTPGDTIDFTVAIGETLYVHAKRIYATGTTVTTITALE